MRLIVPLFHGRNEASMLLIAPNSPKDGTQTVHIQ